MPKDRNDNVLDRLDPPTIPEIEDNTEEECLIPDKCKKCRTSMVCSVLSTFAGMSKIGITVEIKNCPYFKPISSE